MEDGSGQILDTGYWILDLQRMQARVPLCLCSSVVQSAFLPFFELRIWNLFRVSSFEFRTSASHTSHTPAARETQKACSAHLSAQKSTPPIRRGAGASRRAQPPSRCAKARRSEERRVGKECRSRWSP